MKTKKYIITVEVEVENTSDDAVLAIMDEVNSERKQLALTHRINEATAKTHKAALIELMYAFNNKIEPLGSEFAWYEKGLDSNNYANPKIRMNRIGEWYTNFGGEGIIVRFCGIPDRPFPDSKYTTYTGDYNLQYKQGGGDWFTIDSIDQLLEILKDVFKNTYEAYQTKTIKKKVN
jgi:hypothetical protein